MANLPPLKVYWHNPAPLFAARVNIGTPTYPIQDIPFDNVTTGAYTDIGADMLVTFGSAAGLDDYGRTRTRAAATATLLKIGRSSQGFEDGEVNIVNDAYISVYADYRVWSKTPAIVNYVEYKDADLAVGDLTQKPPPIANMGPDRARSIDPDTGLVRFYFDSSTSIAVADGATVASVAWDIGDGAYALSTGATDAAIYADFGAGVRYVTLTVTDSNGKSHTTRRLVLADDPDDSLCVSGMQVTSITRNRQGSTAKLRPLVDLPRADYPDGGHVLIWQDRDPAIVGTLQPDDWADVLFTGFHATDQASSTAQEFYLRRDTALTCVDGAGRMDALPGFDQRVEIPDDDGEYTWGEMDAPNMDKFLCYLIHWHSTAASVMDFFPSGTWTDYPFVIFDAVGDTLANQMQRQAGRLLPDHIFTCDRYGALRVVVNPQLQDPADRTSTVQNSLTEQGYSEFELTYNRNPRVSILHGSAVLTGTDYNEDGSVGTAFCVAPGTAPGQGGREQTQGEQLAQSQAQLNAVTGHRYAQINARYGPLPVTLNNNADPWDFDPAAMTWVDFHVPATVAPQRGLDFTAARCLCTEVSIDYQYPETGTTYRARVMLEPETVGLPALTEEQEAAVPVGEQPSPTLPPDRGLIAGQELVAGIDLDGNLYRTADFQTDSGSGGPTWAQVSLGISETLYSWVVDPFSPGYVAGSGAINGWIATETDIYRVSDLFGTVIINSILTFPTATDASSFHWRTIQASFGRYFAEGSNPWLLCVSYYGATSGHTGTWATYSVDGGATWASEVQISAHYDNGVPARFNPIGVYASPKTPGLAYAAAFTETAHPALADGYVSTDWGATWTALSSAPVDDPSAPLPRWATSGNPWSLTLGALAAKANTSISVTYVSGPSATGEINLVLAPPANTKSITVVGATTCTVNYTGLGGATYTLNALQPASVTRTTIYTHSASPTNHATTTGDFSYKFDFTNWATQDWPVNRDTIVSSPPATADGVRLRIIPVINAVGTITVTMTVTVSEIVLDDGTTYTPPLYGAGIIQPGNALAGTIHLPWPANDDEQLVYFGSLDTYGNRQFRLKQTAAGVITDISPTASGVAYGANRGPFGIRSFDGNRQYMLLAGIGNDSSNDPDDDLHAVFFSDNYASSWVTVVSPIADTGAPTDRPAFEAAFGGDSPQVIFIWGAPDYIAYSADGGVTVDSRVGDLSGTGGFIGIAGGPTA